MAISRRCVDRQRPDVDEDAEDVDELGRRRRHRRDAPAGAAARPHRGLISVPKVPHESRPAARRRARGSSYRFSDRSRASVPSSTRRWRCAPWLA